MADDAVATQYILNYITKKEQDGSEYRQSTAACQSC
jgi:hypothetical protein